MEDKALPKSIGESVLPPAQLSDKQEELCRRLDSFYISHSLKKAKPSDMLRGAIFVAQKKLRSNQDWIAQAANSLREILYPFYSREVKIVPTNKKEVLKKYGSVRAKDELIEKMGRMWGVLNGLTHHGNVEKNNVDFNKFTDLDFEKLVGDFEKILLNILSRQIDIHKEIDDILTIPPTQSKSKRI